jgi:hypothetical protein
LTGISAAKADPEIIASAVANNTNFFMSIPIAFRKNSPIPAPPMGNPHLTESYFFLTSRQSGTASATSEAKKAFICRLFRRFTRSIEGCREVLPNDNKIGRFRAGWTRVGERAADGTHRINGARTLSSAAGTPNKRAAA